MALKSSLILALKPLNGSLAARSSSLTPPRIIATVFNSGQTRCDSTSATTPQLRVSAFEQAMKEIYGERWKSKLSKKEHLRVKQTETNRKRFRKHLEKGDATMWKETQSDEEWRAHVDRMKKWRLEIDEKWKLAREQRMLKREQKLKEELEKERSKQNGGEEEK